MATRSPSSTTAASARVSRASTPASRASKQARSDRKRPSAIATLVPVAVSLAGGLLPSSRPHVAAPEISAPAPVAAARMFAPGCSLPFAGTLNSPSDDHCGIQGGSSDPAKQAESRAKNNFCVSTQSPLLLTHQALLDMQTKSTAANLPKQMPDRNPLKEMGEGKFASYIAFVKNAHYSDVSKGEAVNCNIPGNPTNDIHIVLLESLNDDECKSTTAEMSPHFRPATWTPDSINSAQGHPVRVRGQLFYDGSHTPCTATSRPNPQRASLWEIHPVYSFDVCRFTEMGKCTETDAENWVPLEQWVTSENQ